VAYRAEIQIGVKGASQLKQLQERIKDLAFRAEALQVITDNLYSSKAVQSVRNYAGALNEAKSALDAVEIATKDEAKAVKEYVTALGEANEASARQNKLIEEEITLRNKAKQGLQTQRRREEYLAGPGRTAPTEKLAQRSIKQATEREASFEARKTFAEEIFNIEKNFDKRLRDTAIDNLLKRFQLEENLQKRSFDRLLEAGKAEGEAFDRRLAQQTTDRLAANKRVNSARVRQRAAVYRLEQRRLQQITRERLKAEEAVSRKRKDALGSAIIGGAFPLLFGQGVGAAAGGGLGGAAGGLVGGQFGFGLSLVGTALGTAVDTFAENIGSLAGSLDKPKEALEALEEAGLNVDDSIKQQVDSLLEAGKAYEAQQLVLQQITETLGPDAVSQLAAYDQETKKLQESYQQAYSALVRELLPAMVGFVGLINDVAGAFGNMPDWVRNLISGASYSGPFGITRVQFDALQNLGQNRSEGVQPTAPEQNPEFQRRQQELQQAAEQRKIALRGQSEELRAQLELLNSGLDITTDKGFELAKQVVVVKYLAELEEINNSKLEEGEKVLKRQVALLQQRIGISNLESQRRRAQESAASRAASAAASAAREAEARQKQIEAARISEINVLKERFAYSVKNTQYEEGEIAALEKRVKQLALERDGQLEILDIKYKQSAANAKSQEESNKLYNVYVQQYQLIQDQYNLENKLTDQKIKQLKVEQEIANLQRIQAATNTRRELEQELSQLALPTGDFLADAFDDQRLEQAIRFENTIRGINDQIDILRKRQEGTNGEAFEDLGNQIKGLEKLKVIYGTLLPEIAAAEKQQLAYNQALGLVQGPVSSLVSGLREVVAETKSVEEAFADFLNGLADQLAQTAAQMIAQYIAIGIARKFAGIGSGSGFNFASGSADVGVSNANLLGGLGALPGFANGGNPPVNKPSIVGERGPELFVPRSSGTIVPNDKMMGGTSNVVVNVDASGSKVEGDSDRASQFGKAIGAAIQAELIKQKRPGGLLANT
jgi:hypothetical protein